MRFYKHAVHLTRSASHRGHQLCLHVQDFFSQSEIHLITTSLFTWTPNKVIRFLTWIYMHHERSCLIFWKFEEAVPQNTVVAALLHTLLLICVCNFRAYFCTSFFHYFNTGNTSRSAEKRLTRKGGNASCWRRTGMCSKDNFTQTGKTRVWTWTPFGIRIRVNHLFCSGWNVFRKGRVRSSDVEISILIRLRLFVNIANGFIKERKKRLSHNIWHLFGSSINKKQNNWRRNLRNI